VCVKPLQLSGLCNLYRLRSFRAVRSADSQWVDVSCKCASVFKKCWCMVGTGKLLAAGHVTSCCPAYISGRWPVSPPLESYILRREDVWRRRTRVRDSTKRLRQAKYDPAYSTYDEWLGVYDVRLGVCGIWRTPQVCTVIRHRSANTTKWFEFYTAKDHIISHASGGSPPQHKLLCNENS